MDGTAVWAMEMESTVKCWSCRICYNFTYIHILGRNLNVLSGDLSRGPAMMRRPSETSPLINYQILNPSLNSEQRKTNDYFDLGNKQICVNLLLTGPVKVHAMTMNYVKPMWRSRLNNQYCCKPISRLQTRIHSGLCGCLCQVGQPLVQKREYPI